MSIRAATPADHAAVVLLLEQAGLPLAGVPAGLEDFIVDEVEGRVVGAVGMERHGESALLRSAVVDPGMRGRGVGVRLVQALLDHARREHVRDIYLLTTTAEAWFPRFGFMQVERESVPAAVRASVEFREACPASATVMRATLNRPMRLLFVCTGNSARSQIAETILNQRAAGRLVAESAGSHPAHEVNPLAIEALGRHGYAWNGSSRPRGFAEVTKDWDVVITVCDRAREACPFFPGQPALAHWGMPDPAEAKGTDEERRRAFDRTVIEASRRVDLLLALPVEKLSRMALEQKLKEIGTGAPSPVSRLPPTA